MPFKFRIFVISILFCLFFSKFCHSSVIFSIFENIYSSDVEIQVDGGDDANAEDYWDNVLNSYDGEANEETDNESEFVNDSSTEDGARDDSESDEDHEVHLADDEDW